MNSILRFLVFGLAVALPGAHRDERPQRADRRQRQGDKVRVGGVDPVSPGLEKMAKLVEQQDRQQARGV